MKKEFYDNVFGQLRCEENNSDWYHSTIDFQHGETTNFSLSLDDFDGDVGDKELLKIIEEAKKTLFALQQREADIRREIAEAQLPNYNQTWNDSGVSITIEEFLSHMKLCEVIMYAIGTSSLTYTVGDLFSDHSLIADLNTRQQIEDLDFAG